MAFKTAISAASGEQYKFEKIGQQVQGYYCGSFDHSGDYGDTKKHLIQTDKGMICIFGQKHLIQLLEGIQVGVMVIITYTALQPSKKKGFNPMKVFQVQYDEEDNLDNEALAAATAPAEDQGGEPGYEGGDAGTEPAEEPQQEEPAQPAPRAAAPRQQAQAPKAPAQRPTGTPISQAQKDRAAALLNGAKR